MSNKNNSPEQKRAWRDAQAITYREPMALPNQSTAIPFWSWNKRSSQMKLTPARKSSGKQSFVARIQQSRSFGVMYRHGEKLLKRSRADGKSFGLPHAIARKFKDASNQVYGVMTNGAIIRITPLRPWAGKSERRQVIKNRREDREMAAANS